MPESFPKLKEASLLFAGAILGFSLPQMILIQPFYWFVIAVLLVFIGMGWAWHVAYILPRKQIYKFKKKIGIYAPYEVGEENSSWVDINLERMIAVMRQKGFDVGRERHEWNMPIYPIIVNPYGGAYPEKDSVNLTSLDVIFRYVRSGGIYVNIADIPFFYAFDRNLKRRINTTPFSEVTMYFEHLDRNFLNSILTKKLHCFVFALLAGEEFESGVKRVISLPSNGRSKNLFRSFVSVNSFDCTPALLIPYGKGYFVFSTLEITGNDSSIEMLLDLIDKSKSLNEPHPGDGI